MEEMHLLLAHAHRRVEQLQEQLAQQQVTEVLRIEVNSKYSVGVKPHTLTCENFLEFVFIGSP